MIKIDRGSVRTPMAFSSPAAAERRERAADFFGNRETARKQKRFDFNLGFAQPELRDTLRVLFFDKCAYCEKTVSFEGKGTAYVDRFRPTTGAIGGSGEVAVDGYWWLGFEWENMYACCAQCNRAKGSRFPVERSRAKPGSKGQALVIESALLLDPCLDDPSGHLVFDEQGFVSGTTLRGRITCEIFSLNRPELLALRKAAAAETLEELAAFGSEMPSPEHFGASRSFSLLRRQILERKLQLPFSSMNPEAARQAQVSHEKSHQAASVEAPDRDLSRERARTRYLERVKLRNVGIHTEIDLAMSSVDSLGAPWMVLLGENGVGKSTLLKAVAFALSGSAQWMSLGANALALLPRRTAAQKPVAEIELFLSDGDKIHMRIDTDARQITGNAADAKLFVLAFGATRLAPTAKHVPPNEPSYSRLTNLFDPFVPLGDATQWLLGLSKLQFERAGRTLKSLLDLSAEAVFRAENGRVLLEDGNLSNDIRTLSDGYQTIMGVGCDIMSVLLRPDLPIEHAEGLVLIDEIGNHLHPAWRMRIVEALKRAFPRVQFIATTHEPLCLRGLDNDEVAVLRKDRRNQVHLVADLPPIQGLLVDQILSSPHFGLQSTIDPEFAAQLDEYYALIAKPELTLEENRRVEELLPIMNKLRIVGDNPREQIMLRTIDKYLAEADAALEPVDPASLPEDVTAQLMGLLAATEGSFPVEPIGSAK